jgi:cobyric acid synthase
MRVLGYVDDRCHRYIVGAAAARDGYRLADRRVPAEDLGGSFRREHRRVRLGERVFEGAGNNVERKDSREIRIDEEHAAVPQWLGAR